jgi:HlyD family secretion protein
MRRGRLLALGTAAAVMIGSGCSRPAASGHGEIVLHGNIEVIDAQLSFKIPGRMVERAYDEGDRLREGALVARLDDRELGQQLAARRAELAGAEAALAELEAGSRPAEIAAAEAVLGGAKAELVRAETEAKRQDELRARDVATERDSENARAQRSAAEARVQEATARLALLREGPRRETIAQARARVSQAQAAVALAETQVDNARLLAPFSGAVLERHAEPGEFLAAGAPVLTVADLSRVWVRGYVAETDLGRIRLGQEVDVRTDSYPDRGFVGRVSFIADEAEFTPKSVQTTKERVTLVFRIKVDLENPDGVLKPGMPVDAHLRPAAAP